MSNQIKDSLPKVQDIENNSGTSDFDVETKKVFIEPEISQPVDVLEATRFFQGPRESGAQNIT